MLSSFRFLASLGLPFHGLLPLPFRFLTSAVFAFFRQLQFWIPTTQPLLFLSLSSCLRLTVASTVLRSCFRSFGLPRSLPPGFPCVLSRFRYSALLFVSFRSTLLRSHSCSTGAYLPLSLPAFSSSVSLPFVRFPSDSSYSAFCFFLSVIPASASQWLPPFPIPLSLPRFPRSFPPDLSCVLSRFSYLASLPVSFRPSLLRSRSCSTGDPL